MKNIDKTINRKDNIKIFEKRRSKLLPTGVATPVTAVSKAMGSKIIDLNGKEYIDFVSGVGVMVIGHSMDVVNQAIQDQIKKFSHTCFGVVGYNSYLDICEKMVQLFPHSPNHGDTKVFLTNSGTDSVENAVKIARSYTKRGGIVAFTNAFHGRNYMAMTLTDKPKNYKFCSPLPGEVYRLRFPSYFHYGYRESRKDYLKKEIDDLKDFFEKQVNSEEIAAVIFELVQGESGFSVMPIEYLQELKKICIQNKILMIVDEVQSGFARTGKWAAYQHYQDIGFIPDLSVWAKAMGAGYPLGAVMGRKKIMDNIPPGILGGTYLGNPVACAAGKAAIDYMETIDLPALAEKRGMVIRKKFEDFYQEFDAIGDVRGLGAMMAIEFCDNRLPNKPNAWLCKELITACRESGLLLMIAGPSGNVVRVLCPLNIEIKILERGLQIIEKELKKLLLKYS